MRKRKGKRDEVSAALLTVNALVHGFTIEKNMKMITQF